MGQSLVRKSEKIRKKNLPQQPKQKCDYLYTFCLVMTSFRNEHRYKKKHSVSDGNRAELTKQDGMSAKKKRAHI